MASAPFTIDQTLPADDDLISQHPTNARTFRDVVESWLLVNHNTSGYHSKVSFSDQSGDITAASGVGLIWKNGDSLRMRSAASDITYDLDLVLGRQTIYANSAPGLILDRPDASTNSVLQFRTSAGSVYVGFGAAGSGGYFAVGGSTALSSSSYFAVNSIGAIFSGTLTVSGTISGPASGLTALNASNLASGTVPSARLSGVYSAMTQVNLPDTAGNRFTGPALSSATQPAFTFTSNTTSGLYDDTGLPAISQNGVRVVRFDDTLGLLLDVELAVAQGGTGADNGADALDNLGAAHASLVLTAGDGLTGGGSLTTSRTIDMGTPGTLTGATSNAATASSHTHALGSDVVVTGDLTSLTYTGTNAANVDFPIGSTILMRQTTAVNRAAAVTVRLDDSAGEGYTDGGAGALLTGTWHARGAITGSDIQFVQRVG